MPHFPKPFYRKARRRWYVEINRKQVNLGPDRDEAFQKYQLMASPEPVAFCPADTTQTLAALCDRFLEWVQTHRAEPTDEGYLFPSSEAKGKSAPRIVYLTETAMEITRGLMVQHPAGPLFRNSRGNPWTPDTVNSAVDRIRLSMGKAEMERRGETISDEEIDRIAKTLNPFGCVKGKKVKRSNWQLRAQAKRKLLNQRAKELLPRYSLYALRHSWATNALKRGLDSLTVAILMGHQDPSMLAKVYQHLSHNPEHLLKQARRAAM